MKSSSAKQLAKHLRIRESRALEAKIKAKFITAIGKALERKSLTHAELAKRSGVPRSAVTGILNGSLQKVSLDRILRLAEAAELTAEVRIKQAA